MMRRSFFFLLVLPAFLHAQEAAEPQTTNSKITSVTVYADRAQVTRDAKVKLVDGLTEFAFPNLPGWIDDSSVRVQLTPPQSGQIQDVRVQRQYLAESTSADVRAALAALQEIQDEMTVIQDERAALEAQSKHLESIRVFSLEKLPKDAATRPVPVEEYESVLSFIHESQLKIAEARRALDLRERTLRPELEARDRKVAELQGQSKLEEATIYISIDADAAANSTLSLSYLTPGATWEPVHDLRTLGDAKEVVLESFAVVTQTTGEHWDNAVITVASQSSTELARIPELESLLVGGDAGIPNNIQMLAGPSFDVAQTRYETQNFEFYNQIGQGGQRKFAQEAISNISNQADVQDRNKRVFQTLQQRGTTAQFQSLSKQTVRAEGKPVRIPIGSMKLAANPRVIAAPEASLNAVRTVRLQNSGDQPLLPGRVSLFLDGAFQGMTESPFVAPQESFSLYLGVVDQVKLSRRLDRNNSELTRWGNGTRMQVSFVVEVENLRDEPVQVNLAERIPVSNSIDVRIKNVRILPEEEQDEKGLVKWDVNLKGKEKRQFLVEYAIEYPTALTTQPPAQGQSEELINTLRKLEVNF